MPAIISLLLLVVAFVLAAVAIIESPRNYVAWAVLILIVLALWPRVA